MRVVSEYSIAEGSSILKLSSAVNMAIRDGFEPFGNIVILETEGEGWRFLQPVVKYGNAQVSSFPPPPIS